MTSTPGDETDGDAWDDNDGEGDDGEDLEIKLSGIGKFCFSFMKCCCTKVRLTLRRGEDRR